jgi:DNA-binding response OmpR family regulator
MTTKALIIDDDPRIRRLLQQGLSRHGFTVLTAENGRPGLKLFQAERPELVITDILMPDIEGIETIMTLKRADNPPKVIAISGGGRLAGREFLKWARHLGADEVMPKPFRVSALISTARTLLGDAAPQEPAPPQQPAPQAVSLRDRLPDCIVQRAALTLRRDRAFAFAAA